MRGKSVTLCLFVFGLSLAAANEDSKENSDEEGWVYLPVPKANTTEPPRTTPEGTTTTSTTTTPTEPTTATNASPEDTTSTTTDEDSGDDSDEEGWIYLVRKRTTERPQTTANDIPSTSTTSTTDEDFTEDPTEDSGEEGMEDLPVQKATTTTEPPRTTPDETTTTLTTTLTTTTTTELKATTDAAPEESTGTTTELKATTDAAPEESTGTTTEQRQTTTDAPPSKPTTTIPALELSCQQIRQFVDGHNWKRFMVANGTVPRQPAAETMKSMIWDEELAAKASQWASQNRFSHNPDRTVGSGKYTTGENIYKVWGYGSYTFVVDEVLESWFDEHRNYTYGSLKESDNILDPKVTGHYTQMVWSESTHVGCGVAPGREGPLNTYLVVCNYGPAGNYIGRKPYRSGSGVGALVCGAGDCSQQYGHKC